MSFIRAVIELKSHEVMESELIVRAITHIQTRGSRAMLRIGNEGEGLNG